MLQITKLRLTFLLLSSTILTVLAETPRRCTSAPRCSSTEDVVWATDGQQCHVFRNGCLLLTQNCDRLNRSLAELKEVPKEECQKLCSGICTFDYTPVCADYNGVRKTFPNHCALTNHICSSGETYSLFRREACESSA